MASCPFWGPGKETTFKLNSCLSEKTNVLAILGTWGRDFLYMTSHEFLSQNVDFSNTSKFECPEDTTSQHDLAAYMGILSSEALAGHNTKLKMFPWVLILGSHFRMAKI